MLYQNDPKLPDAFRREGCRARSLMAMAEINVDRALTETQIELCIAKATTDPAVLEKDMTAGADEHKIVMYAFKLLTGYAWFYRQIGEKRDHGFFSWQGAPLKQGQIGFTVLHWVTDFAAGHWTLGDQDGDEIWDPWCTEPGFDPWDETGTEGYRIHKRNVDLVYAYGLFKE